MGMGGQQTTAPPSKICFRIRELVLKVDLTFKLLSKLHENNIKCKFLSTFLYLHLSCGFPFYDNVAQFTKV